jgi:hypothetical protein
VVAAALAILNLDSVQIWRISMWLRDGAGMQLVQRKPHTTVRRKHTFTTFVLFHLSLLASSGINWNAFVRAVLLGHNTK